MDGVSNRDPALRLQENGVLHDDDEMLTPALERYGRASARATRRLDQTCRLVGGGNCGRSILFSVKTLFQLGKGRRRKAPTSATFCAASESNGDFGQSPQAVPPLLFAPSLPLWNSPGELTNHCCNRGEFANCSRREAILVKADAVHRSERAIQRPKRDARASSSCASDGSSAKAFRM